MSQRESMEYDVVVVGGGPAGLAAAIKLRQLAKQNNLDISVCVLEKGAEVGAHILSGALFETRALDELLPNWQELDAPIATQVKQDATYLLTSQLKQIKVPNIFVPKSMHNTNTSHNTGQGNAQHGNVNHSNYIVSMGEVCAWLAEQAEGLGVEIYPGFSAAEILYHDDGRIKGVATGEMGRGKDGEPKVSYEEGMELHAKYTLFAEGARGQLTRQLIDKFNLAANKDPQHYGLGIKEVWDLPAEQHQEGLVEHGAGWPLSESKSRGGYFLYHAANNKVFLGLFTDLDYQNPHVSPYEEFQRLKHHPKISATLKNGKRVAYGARVVSKGGLNSLPKMSMPGGFLLGCAAGTLNFSKIKGNHTAMKSGMLAAEHIAEAIKSGIADGKELEGYAQRFADSWLGEELRKGKNFGGALKRFGVLVGGLFNFVEQNILGGKSPVNFRQSKTDHESLLTADKAQKITYPKHDNILSFDRLSSVALSNTFHEEDQPAHLTLKDTSVPITLNLAKFDAPEQRYCPAGVYEIIAGEDEAPRLQINAQNCVHCKTCDIKDPSQNIVWVAPEGTGGPNYSGM